MKISDITKKAKKSKPKGKLVFNFNFKKLKVSLTLALWAGFVLVFAVELFALYAYGYKNLVFTALESPASNAAVRVNFVNYDKVIQRLDEVQNYHTTSTINFLGKDQNTGRSSPFDDPE